ncbi:MAG: SDR family oxidoreductase [Acidobacteria bacterium]|jgi:dTDP-4-dehydrorhamnose reductase|nr:SDR family oxidoreductase [Acidobacteriota bacterium]
MKILVFGGGGMLGHKLVQKLQVDFDVWTSFRDSYKKYENLKFFNPEKIVNRVNVLDFESIQKTIREVNPEILINAVGIIKQLPSSKDVIKTLLTNSIFPHQLAEICAEENRYLINISTDCVFDGAKGNYKEEDISNASDLYGRSKSLGEVNNQRCLTIRTSIIGRELFTKNSLVEWFLSNEEVRIKGFVNAIYSGFPTIILAEIISELLRHQDFLEGLYHVSSEPINKYELLKLLKKAFQIKVEIEPFEEFKIDRSLNSDKFRKQTNFAPLSWEEMITIMANDKFPYQNK